MIYGLGSRIEKLRKAKGMSQKEVGSRIGVSGSSISHYENETKTPSAEIILELASLFNVRTDYLFGQDNKEYLLLDGLTPEDKKILGALRDKLKATNNQFSNS